MKYKNRDDVIIKFADGSLTEDLKKFKPSKEKNDLFYSSQIQNILHWNGLAPRVYDIGFIDDKPCQITEKGDIKFDKSLGEKYGFNEDLKFYKSYEEFVTITYYEYGKYGKVYYQNVPELGIKGGPRKSLDRISYMQLNKIDFKDKSVLDIGCAGGFFCRYADDQGASKVRGVDMERPAYAAKHMANFIGNFNIDYEVADLSKGYSTKKPFDIVFFLSMIFHINVPDAVKNAKMVVYEDNGKLTKNKKILGKPWTTWFSKIEFIGEGKDHGDKSIYHLYK